VPKRGWKEDLSFILLFISDLIVHGRGGGGGGCCFGGFGGGGGGLGGLVGGGRGRGSSTSASNFSYERGRWEERGGGVYIPVFYRVLRWRKGRRIDFGSSLLGLACCLSGRGEIL